MAKPAHRWNMFSVRNTLGGASCRTPRRSKSERKAPSHPQNRGSVV